MKKSKLAALVAGTALAAITFGCGGESNTNNANVTTTNTNRPVNTATPMATPAMTTNSNMSTGNSNMSTGNMNSTSGNMNSGNMNRGNANTRP
jgi:hypothetical protein